LKALFFVYFEAVFRLVAGKVSTFATKFSFFAGPSHHVPLVFHTVEKMKSKTRFSQFFTQTVLYYRVFGSLSAVSQFPKFSPTPHAFCRFQRKTFKSQPHVAISEVVLSGVTRLVIVTPGVRDPDQTCNHRKTQ
jgi:hypothetical protein